MNMHFLYMYVNEIRYEHKAAYFCLKIVFAIINENKKNNTF